MYTIGIEDLVANSLIALYQKKDIRSVDFVLAEKYGRAIVKHLRESGKEAILTLSRNLTTEFLYQKSSFFDIQETDRTYIVSLKENINFNEFLEHYRGYLALDVLLAMVDDKVLNVLFEDEKDIKYTKRWITKA